MGYVYLKATNFSGYGAPNHKLHKIIIARNFLAMNATPKQPNIIIKLNNKYVRTLYVHIIN